MEDLKRRMDKIERRYISWIGLEINDRCNLKRNNSFGLVHGQQIRVLYFDVSLTSRLKTWPSHTRQ
jgi:hypothetical protein